MNINDAELISWVEQFRHLYDKKEKDYKDRNVVENSWLFIGNKLKASSSECRLRWISLRNRFSKERCKFKRSGSGASDHKDWPLMNNLSFLHECVKRRKTFGNVELPDNTEDNSQDLSNTHDSDSEELLTYKDVQYLDGTSTEYVENLDEQTDTHGDFGAISMDDTVESVGCTPRAAKRPRFRSTPLSQQNRNEASVQTKMDEAIDVFKKFITEKKTLTVEENSLQNFCNSLYADLKNIDKAKLLKCKVEIMQVISKYSE